MFRLVSIILFVLFSLQTWSQSSKKFYKTGEEFFQNGQYSQSIEFFTKSIQIDPNFSDGYMSRAKTYEQLNMFPEALKDYNTIAILEGGNEVALYNSARIYYMMERYDSALQKVEVALAVKKKYVDAYELKVQILIALKDYFNALNTSELVIDYRNTSRNFYFHAYIYEKLNDKVNALKFYKITIEDNPQFALALVALARVQLSSNMFNESAVNVNRALSIDKKIAEAYIIRSKINQQNLNLHDAINDISQAILLDPNNLENYFMRASYYEGFSQFQSAINDYNKILFDDKNNGQALFARANCYENIGKIEDAIKDYKSLADKYSDNEKYQSILKEASERLFELKRESDKPSLEILNPEPSANFNINIPKDRSSFVLEGIVKDQSDLAYIKINNENIEYQKENGISKFSKMVDISTSEVITIACSDIYNNADIQTYTVKRTEIEAPLISILAPYASDNKIIYLADITPTLFIEGKIKDESLIKSIFIDGVLASYRPEDINPSFSAIININNKKDFKVTAVDDFGNVAEQVFTLNREDAQLSTDNPMGKTWVIFVENSNYESFPSLEGPSKDVTLMQTALSQYQIHNFIHKKDMSKNEMERFFSIELRDLIRSNRVNSVMVWYAGHGKYINETGYWIPVDAVRDDEFTYFNINQLKGSLQTYSKYVVHTLVITDACETGPAFYTAMRDALTEKSCDDATATRFKSSQVFSSAGYELAVDNSQFTKTFANTLASNPDACIPIETVVINVRDAVKNSNQQEPIFGKIGGMEDENGTFFFMAK